MKIPEPFTTTILVIGNGFDLAHNLPTRYEDFLNFLHIFKTLYKNPIKLNDCKNYDSFNKLNENLQKFLLNINNVHL